MTFNFGVGGLLVAGCLGPFPEVWDAVTGRTPFVGRLLVAIVV
jgi:hypothetical protein